jgi:hypothetical protein
MATSARGPTGSRGGGEVRPSGRPDCASIGGLPVARPSHFVGKYFGKKVMKVKPNDFREPEDP